MREGEYGLILGGDFEDTNLCGEVNSKGGVVKPEFIKAVEKLMEKHQIIYVQLYWDIFKGVK